MARSAYRLPSMSSTIEELPAPDFEIDHPDDYAQYFLSNPREISFHLKQLVKRGSLITAHIDEGKQFFLTAIVAVDEEKGEIFIDPAQAETLNSAARVAHQITLVANLDRVKIQLRLAGLRESEVDGRRALSTDIPTMMLRLQRREFFRLEPPLASPIGCQIAIDRPAGNVKTFEPKVADISGGGVSLTAPTNLADACQPDTFFKDCRLDLPGEGVLLVNLRVRKMLIN